MSFFTAKVVDDFFKLCSIIFVQILFIGSGQNVGLELLLAPQPEEYLSHKKPYYGIDVSIHARDNYVDTEHLFSVLPGDSVNAFITPSVVDSGDDIRLLPPSKRNCLFEDEVCSCSIDSYSKKELDGMWLTYNMHKF